jgi:hypothetical protein
MVPILPILSRGYFKNLNQPLRGPYDYYTTTVYYYTTNTIEINGLHYVIIV